MNFSRFIKQPDRPWDPRSESGMTLLTRILTLQGLSCSRAWPLGRPYFPPHSPLRALHQFFHLRIVEKFCFVNLSKMLFTKGDKVTTSK